MRFKDVIDVLSLFHTIRNDFIHIPERLRVERCSFSSLNEGLFVLFLSLFSEVEDFLVATILSSLRTSVTDKWGFIKERARKPITGRGSDLSVTFDLFGNGSRIF